MNYSRCRIGRSNPRRLFLTNKWLSLALCLGGAAGLAAAWARAGDATDKAYSVKLSRPSKVGERYDITVSGSQKTTSVITAGGGPAQTQDQALAVRLEGTVEVIAVDSKGGETKLACTIAKFVRTDGKEPGQILPGGSVVTVDATTGEKTQYSLKDGQPTAEQSEALSLVLDAHRPESASDDEVFGTDRPQKVGASWPIDLAKAAADAGKSGVVIKKEDLSGQTTLAGIEHVDGKDYLEVRARMQSKRLEVPMPPGVTLDKTKLEATFGGMFPVDPSTNRMGETTDLKMDIVAKGDSVTVHTTAAIHRESETVGKKR